MKKHHAEARATESTVHRGISAGKISTWMTVTILLASVYCISNGVPSTIAQSPSGATFTSITATHGISSKQLITGGTAKIYYKQNPVYVNLTLFNANCSMSSENFFWIQAISVGTGGSWPSENLLVNEGTSTTLVYDLCNLTCGACIQQGGHYFSDSIWNFTQDISQPLVFTFRLYYNATEERVLEDERTVTLNIIKDFVSLSQDPSEIEKGKSGTLGLSVSNLDSESIFDVNITLTDSGAFQCSSPNRALNTIAGSSKRSTAFDLQVPENLETGSYNVTLQIAYKDFSGAAHIETKNASVTVGLNSGFPTTYILATVLALIGICGLLVYARKRAKTKGEQPKIQKR